MKSTRKKIVRRRRLALVLPAHNEELILGSTIRSAIAGGMKLDDIYVVDDDSSDKTRRIALRELPRKNILTVFRSGKAQAIRRAIDYFGLASRYTWVHVADADSIFCPDYFSIYRRRLNVNEASAAVGFVQSMRGNWIATYRSFSYTYGQHIFRRLQSWVGVIAVLPGPVTCFKSDILKDLDFSPESLTEDFDLTLQIHRKKLGHIRFIPEAVSFTQDPRTLNDFINQTLRWQRGFFQGLRKYKIGLRPKKIDFAIGYQMSENVYYLFQLLVILPLLAVSVHGLAIVFTIVLSDIVAIISLAIFSAYASQRPAILLSLPYFYILKFIEIAVFLRAFIEVIVLKRYQTVQHGWRTEGRRYQVSAEEVNNTV